ncbi:MAG TPA: hypothetical protein VI958_06020, partial [Acidobacteriota bacterium]
GNATNVVLPSIGVSQFDPHTKKISQLVLPPLRFTFQPSGAIQEPALPLPVIEDRITPAVFLVLLAFVALTSAISSKGRNSRQNPKFTTLVQGKKPSLQISRKAAQNLYRQVNLLIAKCTEDGGELAESLKRHLPEREWLEGADMLRKLEWTAFSPLKVSLLTYGELKTACERMEKQWQA